MPSLLDINPLTGGICHRGGINSPQGTKANKWKKSATRDTTNSSPTPSRPCATVCDGKIMHYLWLAAGGLYELTAVKLFPLRGRRIILFPDTDPDGKDYALWYRVMTEARRLLGQPVAISPLLELQATPAQKAAKIDLADYWFEASIRGV